MDGKRLYRIIRNPRHIPGVHNYCDRWCERCRLTLRCAVFAMQAAMEIDRPAHNQADESLWPRLETLQPQAQSMLAENADHAGVGLPSEPTFKSLGHTVDSHRLGAAAKRYMEFAHRFLGEQRAALAALPAVANVPVTAAEALDVINHYHLFITVKLSRALRRNELDEEIESEPAFANMPSDQDGSAKIALIAIDRSILAWCALTPLAPPHQAAALSAALTLHRLRLGIEKQFPQARSFQRPGFDTLRFPGQ